MLTKRKRRKVSWSITCSLPFTTHQSLGDWEKVVRKLVQQTKPLFDDGGMIDLYDEGTSTIITECVLMN